MMQMAVLTFYLIVSLSLAADYATSKDVTRSFDGSAENISAIAGTTAILPCSVDLSNSEPSKEITWMSPKNILIAIGEKRIIDDTRMSIIRPRIPDWNLQIRELEFYDRGMYICSLNTRPMSKKNVHLEVYVKPNIFPKIKTVYRNLKEGDTANLTCNATGYPEPTITWYRENEAIGRQGPYLLVHNITRYCSGTYTCHAFNGVGPAVSQVFSINVHFQPEVKVLNKILNQDLEKETILQCEISASPQAIVNWRKGDHIFTANSYRRITTDIYEKDNYITVLRLIFQKLTMSDFGDYICEASNRLGKDQETMQLVPTQGVYGTPESVTKNVSNSNPVVFNFSTALNNEAKASDHHLISEVPQTQKRMHDILRNAASIEWQIGKHGHQHQYLFPSLLCLVNILRI